MRQDARLQQLLETMCPRQVIDQLRESHNIRVALGFDQLLTY